MARHGYPPLLTLLAAWSLGAAVGLLLWANLGAYREDSGDFFLLCLVAAAAFGLAAPSTAAAFGLALPMGVLPLSFVTANQGDHDGLWLLIVPMLMALCGFAGVVALIAARFAARESRVDALLLRWTPAVLLVALLTSLLTILLTVRAGRYDWRVETELLDAAPVPSSLVRLGEPRDLGNPKRSTIGSALVQDLSSTLPPPETCVALHDLLRAWADSGTVTWSPIQGEGSEEFWCSGTGSIAADGRTHEVEARASWWEDAAAAERSIMGEGASIALEVQTPTS